MYTYPLESNRQVFSGIVPKASKKDLALAVVMGLLSRASFSLAITYWRRYREKQHWHAIVKYASPAKKINA